MIREAQLPDLYRVMELHVDLKDEAPNYRDLPYEPEEHFSFLLDLHKDEDSLILVNEEDGAITGFLLADIGQYFFNSERFAQEHTVYVTPAKRSGRTGLRMIKALEKWAADKGVHEVKIGTTVGIKSERYTSFLESIGYERLGAVLSKRV